MLIVYFDFLNISPKFDLSNLGFAKLFIYEIIKTSFLLSRFADAQRDLNLKV